MAKKRYKTLQLSCNINCLGLSVLCELVLLRIIGFVTLYYRKRNKIYRRTKWNSQLESIVRCRYCIWKKCINNVYAYFGTLTAKRKFLSVNVYYGGNRTFHLNIFGAPSVLFYMILFFTALCRFVCLLNHFKSIDTVKYLAQKGFADL